MNDITENLLCSQEELERWLDSSPPLSDDEMKAMSAYFDSESFKFTNNILCYNIIINNKQQTTSNRAKQNEEIHH